MHLGTGRTARVVNVSEMYEKLGANVAKSLPDLHAFTGSDFTPSFYRKGKTNSLKKVMSSPLYQKTFTDLGNLAELDQNNVFDILEAFVCNMYCYKSKNSVNDVRYAIFQKTYGIDNDKFFKKNEKV